MQNKEKHLCPEGGIDHGDHLDVILCELLSFYSTWSVELAVENMKNKPKLDSVEQNYFNYKQPDNCTCTKHFPQIV